MSHYAQLDANNIVVNVIVAEQAFIDTLPGVWMQTSYNTRGGVHILGGTPLRKNFAGIGYSYDPQRDAFIPPHPFPSWQLNEESCLWEPPVAYPSDGGVYVWDETGLGWVAAVAAAVAFVEPRAVDLTPT